jgi:hypothetical protein
MDVEDHDSVVARVIEKAKAAASGESLGEEQRC